MNGENVHLLNDSFNINHGLKVVGNDRQGYIGDPGGSQLQYLQFETPASTHIIGDLVVVTVHVYNNIILRFS